MCVLQLQAKGSAWSPSDFWPIHMSQSSWECACRELAASPSLASWLGGHLAHGGRGTELTSAAQLSVRGPGPCWQNHSPAPAMKMDWSKWSIKSSGPKISWKCELRPSWLSPPLHRQDIVPWGPWATSGLAETPGTKCS